jgi:ElaB/YqjD/DUF883 family membrane-anchored ribosome-binding protein
MSDPVTTAKLMEDLRIVVRDAEALLQATAAQTGERIQAVRTRAEESLQNARASLADTQQEVVQHARDAAESTENYVKQNPWQSLGMAAGIGLLLGMLLQRRD